MSNRKVVVRGRAGLCAAAAAIAATPALATASTPHTASRTVITSGKVKRGTVVVTASGLTLYAFTSDSRQSSCYGSCARTWIPFTTSSSTVVKTGSGLSQRLVGKTRRSNGQYQVTYGGHPLYRYVGDRRSGTQNGQDKSQFGGSWYVVSKQGQPLKPPSVLVGGY